MGVLGKFGVFFLLLFFVWVAFLRFMVSDCTFREDGDDDVDVP